MSNILLYDTSTLEKLEMDSKLPTIQTIDECKCESIKTQIDVVIMTVTDIELSSVLEILKNYPQEQAVFKVFSQSETYYIGQFGVFNTVVTKCRMGSIGQGSAILAAEQVLRKWNPRAIIMVGIAFGKDEQKQNIGDVLVASEIISYEPQRIGEEVIYRGSHPPSNTTLLNRFENVHDWKFSGVDDKPCQIKHGAILSGEKLIDNPEFKAQLFKQFPEAIGGEMEGAGLSSACMRQGVAWILVKSICDWADGKKGDKYQRLAARASASLVHHVLSEKTVLNGIEIKYDQIDYNGNNKSPSTLKQTKPKRLAFAIAGTLDKMDQDKLNAIVGLLRKMSGDTSIDIVNIDEGSIKIILEGSEEGIQKIKELLSSGELTDIEGFPVEYVRFLTKAENQKIDSDLQVYQENNNQKSKAFFEKQEINDRQQQTFQKGNYEQAIAYYQKSLKIAQKIQDFFWESRILRSIGNLYSMTEQYDSAIEYYQQSKKIAQEIGDYPGEEAALAHLGTLYNELEQPLNAIDYFQQSLAISEELNDLPAQGEYLEDIGEAYYTLEDYDTAIDYFQRSLIIREEIEDYYGQAEVLLNLGLTYEAIQDYKARGYYEQSLAIARQLQDSLIEFNALSNLGDFYSILGIKSKAIKCYQQCLEIIPKIQQKEEDNNIEISNQFSEIFLEIKAKITQLQNEETSYINNLKSIPIIPSSQSILEQIEINSNAIKSIQPRSKRSQYRAVINWLTKYKFNQETSNLDKVKGLLEAFFHLCEVEDWERSKIILSLQLNTPTLEELLVQLGTWGYYSQQINCCSILLGKSDNITNGTCLNVIGNAYTSLSQHSKSLEYYEQNLKVTKISNDYQQEGITWNNIAIVYSELNNYPQAIESCQKALLLAKKTNDKNNESNVLGTLGRIYNSLGDHQKALEYHNLALAIKQEINDIKGEGLAFNGLGSTYRSLGDYPQAIKYHQQHLEIAIITENIEEEANTWGNLGNVYDDLGDYYKAIEHHQKQLEISRDINSLWLEENALTNLGIAHFSLGNYKQVIEYQNQALIIAEKIEDREGKGNILGTLGLVYYSMGEYEKALEYHSHHLKIARDIGSKGSEASALGNIGNTYYFMEEYKKALDYGQQFLLLSQQLGNPREEATALNNLGNAYDALGNIDQAIEMYQKSLEIARKIGYLKGQGEALCNLGTTIIQIQKYREAIEYLEIALDIVNQTGDRYVEAITLYNIAEVYEKLNDLNNAQKFAQKALQTAGALEMPDIEDYQELMERLTSND